MVAGSAITSESRFVSADRPQDPWRVALPRVNDVEYGIEHRGDHLFILIRDQARPNQELLVAPVADPTATKVRGSCCEHEQPCHPDIKAARLLVLRGCSIDLACVFTRSRQQVAYFTPPLCAATLY